MNTDLLLGLSLSFASALSFAGSNIFVKKGAIKEYVLASIFVTMLASELAVFISSLATGELFRIGTLSPLAIVVYALTGIMGFTVGRTLNYTSIVRVGPSTSATILSSRTIFALIFSIIIISEKVTTVDIIGDLIVTAGILVVSLDRRSKMSFSLVYLLLPLGAAIMVGSTDVLIRFGGILSSMPIDGTLIAYTVGLVSHIPMQGRKLLTGIRSLPGGSLKFLVTAGIFSGMAQVFRFTGLTYAPIFIAVPVIALTPVITVAFSTLFLRSEKIGFMYVLGVVLSVVGIFFLNLV